MPRKLKDIDVDEISLVDAGAVRKKFYIKKRRSLMDLFEILKDFLGPDVELSEEEIAKAKELSEEAAKAIKGALSMLNKYKNDMPDDVVKAMQTLAKYASYGYPAKKAAEIDILQDLTDVTKAGAKLSKATIEQLKKIAEIVKDLIGAAEEKVKKSIGINLENLPPDVQVKLTKLAQIEEEQARKAQEEKDKKITDLIEAVNKQGEIIKKLAKGEPVSQQLEDDPDPKDKDKDPAQTFTKADLAKMTIQEKKALADKGVIDLWPGIRLTTKEN